MAQTIYCDEAGFTGNNLLDAAQPYFAYATVAVDADTAAELVQRTLVDYRIDGDELKGQRLLSFNRGQKAIESLINECIDRALVSVSHKRYVLAAKFFEHIFEPVLAEKNSIFYRAGFHRFVSNIIYSESLVNSERAVKALEGFQTMIRSREPSKVDGIFPASSLGAEYSQVLRDIETFAICHRDLIANEVASYDGEHSLYRWLLDLSMSAIWSLLASWGERFDSLSVYCDASKPLYENKTQFDIMIGRTDRSYIAFEDKAQPLIFNLAERPHFVSSHEVPGIQIADVFASAAAYAFRNPNEERSKAWKKMLLPALSGTSILPDDEVVDLRKPAGFVNTLVLRELVDRSIKQEDLFIGMPEFIQTARSYHPRFLSETVAPST